MSDKFNIRDKITVTGQIGTMKHCTITKIKGDEITAELEKLITNIIFTNGLNCIATKEITKEELNELFTEEE